MPKSHQEDNAWYFKKNNAVEILDQEKLMSANFAASIKELLNDKARLDNLSRNIGNVMKLGAAGNMVEEIFKIIKK
jgi:UDP-N-acetylglucosamine:LPS N-acetylglucosamine transferase